MQTYLLYSFHCSLYKNLLLFVFNLLATQESQLLQPPRPQAIWFHSCQSCTCLLMSWTVSICHTSWHKFCYKIKNVCTYLHSNMPSMSALELSPQKKRSVYFCWMVCQLSSTMLIHTLHILNWLPCVASRDCHLVCLRHSFTWGSCCKTVCYDNPHDRTTLC